MAIKKFLEKRQVRTFQGQWDGDTQCYWETVDYWPLIEQKDFKWCQEHEVSEKDTQNHQLDLVSMLGSCLQDWITLKVFISDHHEQACRKLSSFLVPLVSFFFLIDFVSERWEELAQRKFTGQLATQILTTSTAPIRRLRSRVQWKQW